MQKGKKVNNLKAEMELKQSLIKTRNAIRKKFQDLHSEKQFTKHRISEKYQPIIEPIKSLAPKKKPTPSIKDETPALKTETESESIFKTALPAHRKKLFVTASKESPFSPNVSGVHRMSAESSSSKQHDDDSDSNDEDAVEDRLHEEVKRLSSSKEDDIYGFRSYRGDLYMGKEPVTIKSINSQMNYSIGRRVYPVTRGLTDLLLMKNPKDYSDKDLENYKNMLVYSSAHKKNYRRDGDIRRNKSSIKYKNLIANLFPEKKSTKRLRYKKVRVDDDEAEGEGLKWWQQLNKPQTAYRTFNRSGVCNYKYWDDPNELVDRLRLLVASQAAGHTGHNNEIISIIEELREAKIIV